jgi:hypothetical protein
MARLAFIRAHPFVTALVVLLAVVLLGLVLTGVIGGGGGGEAPESRAALLG